MAGANQQRDDERSESTKHVERTRAAVNAGAISTRRNRCMYQSLKRAVIVSGVATLLGVQSSQAQDQSFVGPPPDEIAESADYEVYNRGPLHEAFASPNSNEPVSGPVIRHEPPEPIDEIPPDQKPEGDNVVWVPGYWEFDEELDDFLWVSGVWRDVPPGRTWVPGYWAEVQGGYQRVAGMWADADVDEVTYLPQPPATQEHGPSSTAPGEGYFWVPGSWEYSGTDYQWRPGYWAPHQRDWIWVPANYVYTPRGYVYVPGYWDYQVAYRGVAFAPVYFPSRSFNNPFAPPVALDSWGNLMLHLFVNPRNSRYYFGDYYGPRFVDYGYMPFFAYHRQAGYDPLFVYFNWRFGNNYYNRMRGWHQYFAQNENYRPRRTYRDQRHFFQRNRDNRVVRATTVTAPFNDVVRSQDIPIAFAQLNEQERERFAYQSRELQEFVRERREAEAQSDDGDRPKVRIRANERLRLRDEDRDEGDVARRRIRSPERPEEMRDVEPDDREGRRARFPIRDDDDVARGRDGDDRVRRDVGRPDLDDDEGRPDGRDPRGDRDRSDNRDQDRDRERSGDRGRDRDDVNPDGRFPRRARRDLPQLPDGPDLDEGRPVIPDRARDGDQPDDRGRPDRTPRGDDQARERDPRRGNDRGAAEDRGRRDSDRSSERDSSDRGRTKRGAPQRDVDRGADRSDRNVREQPDPGRSDRGRTDREKPKSDRPDRGKPKSKDKGKD
ncbi:MAG: hypothetical protein DWQ34_21870 [Planctomycetota bacterium]|nr:MAG: hypothetical protein DWQ34_21870 [Planctomycetota bacterium]REK22469.1 MAG: hypothetical protein DWQ41_19375 [Planctomycetota bacterium]REK34881.1 MAG: hypothetical protein DWQ45_12290 [Planctomycetota bacterium]